MSLDNKAYSPDESTPVNLLDVKETKFETPSQFQNYQIAPTYPLPWPRVEIDPAALAILGLFMLPNPNHQPLPFDTIDQVLEHYDEWISDHLPSLSIYTQQRNPIDLSRLDDIYHFTKLTHGYYLLSQETEGPKAFLPTAKAVQFIKDIGPYITLITLNTMLNARDRQDDVILYSCVPEEGHVDYNNQPCPAARRRAIERVIGQKLKTKIQNRLRMKKEGAARVANLVKDIPVIPSVGFPGGESYRELASKWQSRLQ